MYQQLLRYSKGVKITWNSWEICGNMTGNDHKKGKLGIFFQPEGIPFFQSNGSSTCLDMFVDVFSKILRCSFSSCHGYESREVSWLCQSLQSASRRRGRFTGAVDDFELATPSKSNMKSTKEKVFEDDFPIFSVAICVICAFHVKIGVSLSILASSCTPFDWFVVHPLPSGSRFFGWNILKDIDEKIPSQYLPTWRFPES